MVNITKTCNISFSYDTRLHYPKYGIINLTTQADHVLVQNIPQILAAPSREYNYIFNVSSWNLTLGEYARNYTKFYVELRCTYDLLMVAQIEMNRYRSKDPMIIIPMKEIISYSFHICEPDIMLINVNGYLRRYNMVSIKALDPSNPKEVSLNIYSDAYIQCTKGVNEKH